MPMDALEEPDQPFLRDNQGVPIHEEELILAFHMLRGKEYIAQDDVICLDLEAFILKGPAKGALVMVAPQGHLEQDAGGLRRGLMQAPS
jgi:hypothetical protein